ncbi:MAG: metal-dependent hydrolase [Halieaceae bacterium]|jgi:predicted metal-dependent hydrolase|nr:metal-dependent hydrolase [Halieaceae bacterium]
MKNPDYRHLPKDVDEIVVRHFAFDFPVDLDPVWIPGNPVRSHFFNGLSMTMPYLEPYLIRSILRAREHIDDPGLLEDMAGFNRQEANHFKCHRRYNELLKTNGYPELAALEDSMTAQYARLETRSLRTQLAYSAGFESMTNGFTHWLITRRYTLFANANPHVSSFWLMHMIEETEHKTVAFDTYMAYSGEYLPRAIGVLHGSGHIVGLGIRGMLSFLKKDKILYRPSTILAVVREISLFLLNVGPFCFRALLPGFNPRNERDPQWMKDWVKGYSTLPGDAMIPLLDTTDPDMPVPFGRGPLTAAAS